MSANVFQTARVHWRVPVLLLIKMATRNVIIGLDIIGCHLLTYLLTEFVRIAMFFLLWICHVLHVQNVESTEILLLGYI